ncbi:BTAD domain-containing putative transcriptional regulator [Streptomyces sp. MJP52]|uniref:BTAD domain-containing putative transcriptional regulator n=1 Tax=Streptomyces sp. MJP52 TaxID=2940555 RepID=UPI0024766323|nr:BTAD domain-containing putative transcriptional regulator [Streptomyces sp. MJP52]MDH6223654.1 DNA-binding SARP family transcriptional activator [Streptomyces sp. MJP52]
MPPSSPTSRDLGSRLKAAVTAAATGTVTLAVLVGMPVLLWRLLGTPLPEAATSWKDFTDRLAQPVTAPMVVELLGLFAWACWAAFLISLTREAAWYAAHVPQLLRDRRLHHQHLAGLPRHRALVALCVGTLVIALLTVLRPPQASATTALSAADVHSLRLVAATAPLQVTDVEETPAPSTERTNPTVAEDSADGQWFEYTVVQDDTLWDIAHAHLGDPLKWPRIYGLNKNRLQADGRRLTDPDLLHPGWRLTLPVAAAVRTPTPPAPAERTAEAPPHQSEQTPEEPADSRPPRPNEAAPEHRTAHGSAENPKPDVVANAKDTAPVSIGLGPAGLIGITAAAGLLAARRYWYAHHNRRRDADETHKIPPLSPLVDKAARAAHDAIRPSAQQEPSAEALITREPTPQRPRPEGVVTIGRGDRGEVALDALAVPGGCTWTGPGAEAAARGLLLGILTAAERQRPKSPTTTAVVPADLAAELVPGLPSRFSALTQTPTLADAIQAAEQHLVSRARTDDEADLGASDASPATGPLVLVVTPDPAHTGQLQALAARVHPHRLVLVAVGNPLPGAACWTVAADGTTARTDPQGRQIADPLSLYPLTPAGGREVLDVLLTAHGYHPRLPAPSGRPAPVPPPVQEPAPNIDEEPDEDARAEVPEPRSVREATPAAALVRAQPRSAQKKPVRVHVLGPVTLYARGSDTPFGANLRSEVHEFLALLAAHPKGLVTQDISDKLSLARGSEQNSLKNLRRAVRRALRGATGIAEQEFILLQGDLHRLHPDLIETDLADFTEGLKKSFSSGELLLDDAVQALRHYSAPFAHGSDYLWVTPVREDLAARAIDAAIRLARHVERAGAPTADRDTLLPLLDHLCALHPERERLAQHTIRLYQGAGRQDAAQHTFARLHRALADLDMEPDQATKALVAPRSSVGARR